MHHSNTEEAVDDVVGTKSAADSKQYCSVLVSVTQKISFVAAVVGFVLFE